MGRMSFGVNMAPRVDEGVRRNEIDFGSRRDTILRSFPELGDRNGFVPVGRVTPRSMLEAMGLEVLAAEGRRYLVRDLADGDAHALYATFDLDETVRGVRAEPLGDSGAWGIPSANLVRAMKESLTGVHFGTPEAVLRQLKERGQRSNVQARSPAWFEADPDGLPRGPSAQAGPWISDGEAVLEEIIDGPRSYMRR